MKLSWLIFALAGGGQGGTQPDVDPPNALALYRRPFSTSSIWCAKPDTPVLGPTGQVVYAGTPPAIEQGGYSLVVSLASASDPPMTVYPRNRFPPFSGIQVADDPYGTVRASITIPHWPSGVSAASGLDGHCDIIDPSTGRIHSFYGLVFDTGQWLADIYTWTPVGGRGCGNPTKWQQGPRAGMTPACAGLIRVHEVDGTGAGIYDHVLEMGLDYASLEDSPGFVFPMTNADGDRSGNTGTINEGDLVMLPSTFDVAFSLNEEINKIARTLQAHGARITDRISGPQFVIYVEEGCNLQITQDLFSYARDAADLKVIADALCPVVSVSGWKRILDDASIDLQTDFNLLSMRGAWTNGASYDIFTEKVVIPAGAGGTFRNADDTDFRQVYWAGPTYADVNTLTVHATGGATFKLEIHDGVGALIRETAVLTDGQTADVTIGQFEHTQMEITRGSSGSASSVWIDFRDKSKPSCTVAVNDGTAEVLDLTFNKPVWGVPPSASVFTTGSGKTPLALTYDTPMRGSLVGHLRLNAPYAHGDTDTVSYTKSGTLDIRDAQGNKLENIVAQSITNNLTVDTDKPTFFSAEIVEAHPDRITITMSEPLSGTLAAAAAFAVSGKTVLSRTSVDARNFYLTVDSRVLVKDVVTFDYTQPVSNKLQDASHNLTDSISGVAVTNSVTTPHEYNLQLTDLALTATPLVESGDGTVGRSYTGTAGQTCAGSPADKGIVTGDFGYFDVKITGHAPDATHYVSLYAADGTHSWSITASTGFAAAIDGTPISSAVGTAGLNDWIRVEKISFGGANVGFHLKYSQDDRASWTVIAGGIIADSDWVPEILTFGAITATHLIGGNAS